MNPDEDQSKASKHEESDKSAAKKKSIDVFWMDDEADLEHFQQKEAEERRKSNWRDVKDADVLSQLMPEQGFPGESPSTEEEFEASMRRLEREFQQGTRSGSFAERVSTNALRRFMGAQQQGGTRGRISRMLGNLAAKIFGVIGRSGMPAPSKSSKKRKQTKK